MPPLFSYFSHLRAQAAVEYVLLLAIMLSIGLIVLGISGFFPSFSYSAQSGDSTRYWSGAASPVAIIDFMQADKTLSLVLENKASANIQITNFTVVLPQGGAYSNLAGISLPSGAKTTLAFTTQNCSPRKTFTYNVYIQYGTDDVANLSENGLKQLYVTCSD